MKATIHFEDREPLEMDLVKNTHTINGAVSRWYVDIDKPGTALSIVATDGVRVVSWEGEKHLRNDDSFTFTWSQMTKRIN